MRGFISKLGSWACFLNMFPLLSKIDHILVVCLASSQEGDRQEAESGQKAGR